MSEFKVGQRVKVVTDVLEDSPYGEFVGKHGTVKQVGGTRFDVLISLEDAGEPLWFDDDELEAVA